MIHAAHGDSIFGRLESALDGVVSDETYRLVFSKALGRVRRDAEKAAIFPPCDLPMAVSDLIGLDAGKAEAAAAAATSLWAGADLIDDVADGQLADEWAEVPGRLLALVSTSLLSILPHVVVAEACADDARAAAAFSQAMSEALFAMSEGQARDFESARVVGSVTQYLDLVRHKSGSEFALFACTPAILAGAAPDEVDRWLTFGLAWGTMVQVYNDTVSTIAEGPRNDLLDGKRTLPVLHVLATTSGKNHRSFEMDLDLASHGDHPAVTRAIEAMIKAGAVVESFRQVELLRYRAAQVLPVKLAEVARTHPMHRLLSACSIV